MADAPKGQPVAGTTRGGGFGSRGGDRGRGRGRRGPRRGAGKSEEKEWQPVTKLGRLVKAGKIKSMEEIYLHSLPIKEYQIVDWFLPKLKDEVMKVRTRHICCWEMVGLFVLRLDGDKAKELLLIVKYREIDQARPKANPRWSTNTLQGYCCHWRFRRACWTRNQDLEGSRYSYPRSYHYRQAECATDPKRLLGYQLGRTA